MTLQAFLATLSQVAVGVVLSAIIGLLTVTCLFYLYLLGDKIIRNHDVYVKKIKKVRLFRKPELKIVHKQNGKKAAVK